MHFNKFEKNEWKINIKCFQKQFLKSYQQLFGSVLFSIYATELAYNFFFIFQEIKREAIYFSSEREYSDGVPEPLQKSNRIKSRKITAFGLPTPLDNIQTIGFITGNAIPSLENLLTCVIIRRRSHTGIIDPNPIRIIVRLNQDRSSRGIATFELEVLVVMRRNIGFEGRVDEEGRGEAEERGGAGGGVRSVRMAQLEDWTSRSDSIFNY